LTGWTTGEPWRLRERRVYPKHTHKPGQGINYFHLQEFNLQKVERRPLHLKGRVRTAL
jgi:hypothetical protein